jgi:hypothetical protein
MNPEQIAVLIEKLIDEKLKLASILGSKTLGANKSAFMEDCQKKVAQIRAGLIDALK